tara:strand:+ start:3064 stop:3252 length:189 start_codon:yes stop_codon:yes gene_type:complete
MKLYRGEVLRTSPPVTLAYTDEGAAVLVLATEIWDSSQDIKDHAEALAESNTLRHANPDGVK